MAETIIIPQSLTDKEERYKILIPQVEALIGGEKDVIANLANIVAVLKFGMNFFWVGFYFVKENELVLGPFQGPVACTRIGFGKGVCGTSWKDQRTIIVKDVNEFPGHIACNSGSRSEIVVPVLKKDKVVLVLDVDSDKLADFDETDKYYLEKVVKLAEKFL